MISRTIFGVRPEVSVRVFPIVFVLWALALSGCPSGAVQAPCTSNNDCPEGWICGESGTCRPLNDSRPETDSDDDLDTTETDKSDHTDQVSTAQCCDSFVGVQGDWLRCNSSGDIAICHEVDDPPPDDCSVACRCETFIECERGCYDPPDEIGGAICIEDGECGSPPESPGCNPATVCKENTLYSCNTDELVLRSFPECWQFRCEEVQTCDQSCETHDECTAECVGDGCLAPDHTTNCDPSCDDNAVHRPFLQYVGPPQCYLCTYDVEDCEDGEVCVLEPGEYSPECRGNSDCGSIPMPDCDDSLHCGVHNGYA